MTISQGDRLFKVQGEDDAVVARLDAYFAAHARAEVRAADVMALLCPGENHRQFAVVEAGSSSPVMTVDAGGRTVWIELQNVQLRKVE